MAIQIFVTGGTFDKEYNELNGSLFFRNTHLKELLAQGRAKVEVKVDTLMMIDSLDMGDAERRLILERCAATAATQIVITHGTDTMVETAQLLGKQNLAKTIVLTGAMIPYAFGSSDGLFNMGGALAFAQTLAHGVYIAINGRFFHWDNVRKNRERGEFEELKV